mgnify:CR=1 FL=1|jgi:hypothetical protein
MEARRGEAPEILADIQQGQDFPGFGMALALG